jgi:hypothetical protein
MPALDFSTGHRRRADVGRQAILSEWFTDVEVIDCPVCGRPRAIQVAGSPLCCLACETDLAVRLDPATPDPAARLRRLLDEARDGLPLGPPTGELWALIDAELGTLVDAARATR